MANELSNRQKAIMSAILYVRTELSELISREQASELESFLSENLDDFEIPITPHVVTKLLKEIRKYEPVRARLDEITSTDLEVLFQQLPSEEATAIIKLGAEVICPEIDHKYKTKLRIKGQRCPIHNKLLIPKDDIEEERRS